MCAAIPARRPLRWLATGVLLGVILDRLVPLGAWLALAGLAVLAHLRGYRIHLSVPNPPDSDRP